MKEQNKSTEQLFHELLAIMERLQLKLTQFFIDYGNKR